MVVAGLQHLWPWLGAGGIIQGFLLAGRDFPLAEDAAGPDALIAAPAALGPVPNGPAGDGSTAELGGAHWAGIVPTLLHTALVLLQPQPPRQLWLIHRVPAYLPFPFCRGVGTIPEGFTEYLGHRGETPSPIPQQSCSSQAVSPVGAVTQEWQPGGNFPSFQPGFPPYLPAQVLTPVDRARCCSSSAARALWCQRCRSGWGRLSHRRVSCTPQTGSGCLPREKREGAKGGGG